MAEIKPIQLVPNIAAPFKDSRAEGYVSYYTKMGWDRWNLSLQQLEQDINDRKIEYDAAMEVYQAQLKDIADEKEALQKKLNDIALKKADANERREIAIAKMKEARALREQAQATEKAKLIAKEPSKGSGFSGGGGVGFPGLKNPTDMVLDQVASADRALISDRIKALAGGATTGNIAKKMSDLKQYYDQGLLPSDAPTKDITSFAIFDSIATDLASKEFGGRKDEAKIAILEVASPEIRDQIERGTKRVDAINEAQAGVASGAFSSMGSYQKEYDIPGYKHAISLKEEIKQYDELEAKLKSELEQKQNVQIDRPTLEPIDLITAARKTYLDKFGNIPEGVSLRAGGETLAKYKELMPFEITNALKGVQSFFQKYIDREISAAKAASPSGLLTKDETNFAVERGKSAARKALFGKEQPDTAVVPLGRTPYRDEATGEEGYLLPGNVKVPTKPGIKKDTLAEGPVTPPTEEGALTEGPLTPPTGKGALAEGPLTPPAGAGGLVERPLTPPAGADAFVGPRMPLTGSPLGYGTTLEDLMNMDNFVNPSTPQIVVPSGNLVSPSGELVGPRPNLVGPGALGGTPGVSGTPVDTRNIFVGPPAQSTDYQKPAIRYPAPEVPESELSRRLQQPKNAADRTYLGVPVLPPINVKEPTSKETASPPAQTPEQKSTKEKTSAFLEGAEKAKTSPSAAAQEILKDSIGKYVAATYETNKAKGPSALPLSDLTNTIVSEYAGDMKKQAKAVRLLTQLAYLDDTKNQIK